MSDNISTKLQSMVHRRTGELQAITPIVDACINDAIVDNRPFEHMERHKATLAVSCFYWCHTNQREQMQIRAGQALIQELHSDVLHMTTRIHHLLSNNEIVQARVELSRLERILMGVD